MSGGPGWAVGLPRRVPLLSPHLRPLPAPGIFSSRPPRHARAQAGGCCRPGPSLRPSPSGHGRSRVPRRCLFASRVVQRFCREGPSCCCGSPFAESPWLPAAAGLTARTVRAVRPRLPRAPAPVCWISLEAARLSKDTSEP